MNYNLISISCMELIRSSNTNLLLEKKKKQYPSTSMLCMNNDKKYARIRLHIYNTQII